MTEFESIELVDRYLDRFENLDEKTKYNKERRLFKHLFSYLKDNIAILKTPESLVGKRVCNHFENLNTNKHF